MKYTDRFLFITTNRKYTNYSIYFTYKLLYIYYSIYVYRVHLLGVHINCAYEFIEH